LWISVFTRSESRTSLGFPSGAFFLGSLAGQKIYSCGVC